MRRTVFPERIETDRLRFERLNHDTVDPFEVYDLVTRADWQDEATEHMPWFRLQRLDQVAEFVDTAEKQWSDRSAARYLLRSKDEDGALIGMTAWSPDWEARRAGSDIVLAPEYWGQELGGERAAVLIELTFEQYDLDAFYTTCAAGNGRSRRMIEKYIERYGGRHEGLLRQHSPRPNGTVTDQHRFSIVRDEYEDATETVQTMDFDIQWTVSP